MGRSYNFDNKPRRQFMRAFYIAVAFLYVSSLHAQGWGKASSNIVWTAEAGYTNFRPFQLNDYLIAGGADYSVGFLRTYGIGTTNTFAIARSGWVEGTHALHFYEPIIISGDSLNYRVGGWELMTSLYGFEVLPDARWVDFIVGPGVYWGSIKMRKYFAGGNAKQFEMFKNPFIAPMVRAELRFNLGPVSVGGRWSYRYDISKSHWKKGSSETLPGYKAREMQYIVYLGYVLNWKDK
jgi:hypothetical protein